MKEKKINPLPLVKAFTDYFIRRAKRILKIKNSEFTSITLDVFIRSGHIWIWFHSRNGIVAKVEFESNGRKIVKTDYRRSSESKYGKA